MKKSIVLIILSFVFYLFSQEQNALSFDGTNDCVNISAAVTSATATQPITVEAWIYPTTDLDSRLIASKYYGGDVSKCNFLLTRNSSQKIYIAANGSNVITSNGSVPLNAWTHIAVVFQSGTGNTKVYINGSLDISGSLTYNTVNSSTVMQIGQFTNITSYPVYQEWSGIVDEFRLWNTVLTQAQISEKMNTPLTGDETGLVAYYDFNQGIAGGTNTGLTSLTDGTGHGWDGILNNFALTGTVSNWVGGVVFNPPAPPAALEATIVSSASFSANWSSSQGATGYKLDLATDSLFTQFVEGYNDLDVHDILAWNVSGLTDQTKYYYRIRAYNLIGTSTSSNIISVFTQDPQIPDVPTAAAAENISTDSFRAVWSQEERAWGYYIDVARDSSFSDYVSGFNNKNVGNVTNATVIPLSMDTDYFYRVRSYNAGGTSESSNTVYVKTLYSTDPVSTAPSSGSGTVGDPYVIANLNNLYWIAENSTRWGYHYIQSADIDAGVTKYWFSGQGWSPIGNYSTKFTGSYNGQDHIIDGLFINRPTTGLNGFFGYTSSSTISNLGLSNCNYTGKGHNGGMIGTTENSTINNCFTSGCIKSTDSYWTNTGGLIGEDSSSGASTISNCYSSCNVEGVSHMGGLIGDAKYTIVRNSYSIGHVIGTSWSGGLCGFSGGTVTNSFWDTETSGFTSSNGGTGKTTAEMMTESTFTAAGWDFTNIWKMEDGYPRFKWQTYYPGPFVFTKDISNITGNSSTAASAVYGLGNYEITQHGVCWNATGNPSISDSKTEEGQVSAIGQFSSELTGLSYNTNYFVRAYATNPKGTFYGNQITFLSAAVASETPAGDGTEVNPYQIANLANLYWISEDSTRWNYDYIQTADIDASVTSTWNNGAGWRPIGNEAVNFTGSFNGQNFNINGLYILRTGIPSSVELEFIGLFGYTSNAVLKNINLTNADIKGGKHVGGISGYSYMTLIDNCNVSGSIKGTCIGGIVGYQYMCDTINSSSYCEIDCWSFYLNNSGNSGGGISGISANSIITNCTSGSNITNGTEIGGLAGYNRSESEINYGFFTGSISGGERVGGLVGYNIEGSSITNSYNTGSVQGSSEVGGLVGYNDYSTVYGSSTITACYSTGTISGISSKGGLVGVNNGESLIESCFWDINASGISWSAGGTGLITQEMKDKAIMISAGWDYAGETANGTEDIWNIHPFFNNGYPFLTYQVGVPPGDGTSSDPYQVTSFNDLLAVSESYSSWIYNYIQTSDIDASATVTLNSGAGWSPIGNYNNAFTGSYDGQNHSISSLFINRSTTNYVGLFGRTFGSQISNLSLTDVNISGNEHVGGLSGYNYSFSTVENCTVNGTVTGSSNTGGLAGSNWYSSVISRSSSDCEVTGSMFTGGLVGYNYNSSSIDNSYSRSNVTSSSYYGGGLVGQNITASVTNSYSTGTVTGELANIGGFIGYNNSTVSNCFWDTQTSGLTKTSGGTGKTTAEMKAIATFTNAGWDFTGETTNGTNDYWNINTISNDGYPYLSWQIFVFEAPQNVNGTMTGADFILNWNEVSGASSYSVYSSADPYAAFPTGWSLAGSGITGLSWTDVSVSAAKKFYVVVAVTGKVENINQSVKVKR